MTIVIILSILTLLLTVIFTFLIKKTPIEMIQMRTLSDESIINTTIDLAKTLRITTIGQGVNTHSVYNKIAKANRLITYKNNRHIPLYESEKWLFENFYLVYRNVFGSKNIFNELPHVNEIPRIITLARHIVRNSLGELTSDRVKRIFEAIKDTVSLNFMEIRVINQALIFAILEQIYILSDRIIFQDNCKNAVKNKKLDKKLLKYDSYCHFLFEYKELESYELDYLKKQGINQDKVALSHNKTIMENTMMAQSLFTALHNINDFVPINDGIKYLAMNSVLEKTKEYSNISINTRLAYFSIVEKISKNYNINEAYVMERAKILADYNDMDISLILYDHKYNLQKYAKYGKLIKLKERSTTWLQRGYISLIIFISLVLCYSTGRALHNGLIGVLTFIPAIFISENALSYLFSFRKKEKTIPSMDFEKIPFEFNTMVVISEYITSVEQLSKSINHAEIIKANSPDENIQVALLLDLKKSKAPTDIIDVEVEEYILNYVFNEDINIFIRKRTLIDNIYQGWERKRGAICQLNKMLMTKDTSSFNFILHNNFPCPKYIVTLDADNMVCPNTIKEMVNMIAHPYNRKYDLLSTQNRYNLFSYSKVYSRRFLQESGIDCYPHYSTFYYTFFDREIYCGKGIYRLSEFYKKLEGVFPDKKILSHDIIEGSVLTTGAANIIFEDVPTGFLSDRERRKRWQRGDIQLLPFQNGVWKNSEGEITARKIQPLYKYIMSKNILYNLKELMLLSILLIGVFTNNWMIVLQFGILFYIPYSLNQMKITRQIIYNVRLRYIFERVIRNILLCIEDFLMLGYYALSNTYILFSTLARMVCGKKLLEWKPFYNSQTATKFYSYVKEFSIPTLGLTILNVVIFFSGYFSILFSIYILLSALMYLRLYILSNIDYKNRKIDIVDKKYLTDIALKTYKYFELLRNEKGIISDNLQIKPYKGEAKVTSPTNIGFSMLAEICAYKLNFITIDKCFYNLTKTLNSIEKMKRWEGNLYNWYDLDTLEPINNFVSSVDIGNFTACLLIVKEFFRENQNMVGELRAELMIKSTNLEALYDQAKNLFYLGFDGQKLSGHYDLLSSEARLLSIIFIALYGKKEHFHALHRDYTSLKGNTMLSWSGTMFEYLMPDLFLPLPCFSTLKNTAINIVDEQIREKYQGIWGISESAYAMFDEKQHYQYHAFGLKILSLRNAENKGIISPYSSALALPYRSREVIENFHNLEKLNMLDEYGFFESIDFEKNNSIIYSYMTHHQGMILCALTNKLTDNYLVNLMQNNVKIAGSIQLFNENMFTVRNGVIYKNTPKITTAHREDYYKYSDNLEQYYNVCAITDANTTQFFCANGNNFCQYKKMIIDKFVPIYQEAAGGYFYVKNENGEYHSPTYLPLYGKQDNFTFAYSQTEAHYQNLSGNLTLSSTILSGIGGTVRKLTYPKYIKEIAFYMPVTLNTFDGYYSHPTFNDLFIETLIKDDILYLKRRAINKDGDETYIAVIVKGLNNIRWETNRINFIGRNRTAEKPQMLFSDNVLKNPSIGDVLSPCIAFNGEPDGTECQLCMLFGSSMEEIEEKIKLMPCDYYSYALACSSRYALLEETQEILGELLYANYPNKILQKVIANDTIDKFNEFTNNKKVISYVYSETNADKFIKFIEIIKNLQVLNLPVRVVIYVKNRGNNNLVQYVHNSLIRNIINDFMILDNPDLLEYSFIAYNDELNYTKKQISNVKIEEIKRNLDNNIDFELEVPFGFASGYGVFDNKNIYNQKSVTPTPLPYCNIICGKYGGIIATNNGGGFYYFNNSRENKVIRFDNDFVADTRGELLCFKQNSGYLILNGGCSKNRTTQIKKGEMVYSVAQNKIFSKCSDFVICDGKARVKQLDIENNAGGYINLIYTFYPCLDWVFKPNFIGYKLHKDILQITNLRRNETVYIRIIGISGKNSVKLEEHYCFPSLEYFSDNNSEKLYFVSSQDLDFIKSLNTLNIPVLKEQSIAQFLNPSNIQISSKIKSFDLLASYLPYQIISSRINGRAGFYQVGGAIGFRDQLQDVLAFSNCQDIIKNQIVEACLHQYEEGDVMHWWHPPQFGLRTRITDDKLFLPYAVCEYLEFSKNMEFLEYSLPYLKSSALKIGEYSRLENPIYTAYSESIFKHCLKALNSSLNFGEHGLLLMGSGDWNDGMDYICKQGKGESVFNSMFAYYVINKFVNYCSPKVREELIKEADLLKENINKFGFDTDRYMRLYSDDGRWLGTSRSESLTLDLLVQSFAVISGVADYDRSLIVLETAKQLIDKKAGIIKLLSPPLDNKEYLGYISAYPKGVRENGGQYTHAAMWYLLALTKIGKQEEAFELFQMMNPVEKGTDMNIYDLYKGEPYALCGDVYSNKQNYGRSGWSWYTGSASWAYRLIIEQFFGLKRRGQKLYIYPKLPEKLLNSTVEYYYMDSIYKIIYKKSSATSIIQDGVTLADNCIVLEESKKSEIIVSLDNDIN